MQSLRKSTYTSKIAVVEFVHALGTWMDESLLKRIHKAPFFFFCIMADEWKFFTWNRIGRRIAV